MESLMLVCQLREEIAYNFNNFHMPCSLVLEALTTLRCCEDFSPELLGNSVLKYAVSCDLFLKYLEKCEGKSGQRQRTLCNANLHELGINRRTQEYIRDSAFEPHGWVAPGQLSVHPVPCSHGVDSSEVPLDSRYHTFIPLMRILYMVITVIEDIGGWFLKHSWGIEAELGPAYVDKVIKLACSRFFTQKVEQISLPMGQ